MKLVIVDYGSGNLRSVYNTVTHAADNNVKVEVTGEPSKLKNADRIILPGVGAFADCKKGINDEMEQALREQIQKNGKPFLGICVGMQLMTQTGLEKGTTEGFGWLKGEVAKMKPSQNLKVPQIGWNDLIQVREHKLLSGIKIGEDGLNAYFVHSYQMVTEPENVIAVTEYGGEVTAMVAKDNMAGTQFHPEKSQKLGINLISNFLGWKP